VSYTQVDVIEVSAWGQTVGAVALDPGTEYYAFEYDDEWVAKGQQLSPIYMPNKSGTFVFPNLATGTYHRLPAMLGDALPDRFGNALVDSWMADNGVPVDRITPLDRLAYAADRGMGALTFRPPADQLHTDTTSIQLADLVTAARSMESSDIASSPNLHEAIRQLIQVGTSAGGARAKAVIAYNPTTDQIRAGQLDAPEGFEHWLIKLDGVDVDLGLDYDPFTNSQGYGQVEYAYYLMAQAADVEMSQCKILHEGSRVHFLSRRFDRTADGHRIHMQSLCAIAHLDFKLLSAHSYNQYLDVVIRLELGSDALEQAFRRMVFNVVAVNRDDHTKNLAFLLPEKGDWKLSPAFDITHAHNPSGEWTRRHQMSVNGKFDKIGMDDLVAVGDQYQVRNYRKVIGEVQSAVSRWIEFAELAGVTHETTARIGNDLTNHTLL